jgi:hypothetical protein
MGNFKIGRLTVLLQKLPNSQFSQLPNLFQMLKHLFKGWRAGLDQQFIDHHLG